MSDSDDTVVPEGLWFPLNSRRLTTKHLQLVAETMKLPTSMSTEELRQLIDGTLADMDHDPANSCRVAEQGEALQNLQEQLEDALQQNMELKTQLQEEQRCSEDLHKSWEYEKERAATVQRQLEAEIEKADQAEGNVKQPKCQASQEEVKQLKGALQTEKDKAKQVWKRNCQQLTEQEALLNCKEKEISRLKADLARLQPTVHCGDIRDTNRMERPVVQGTTIPGAPTFSHRVVTMEQEIQQFEQYTARDSDEEPQFEPRKFRPCRARRGKAPPVDPYTGEDPEIQLDDWIPALERACEWNDWTPEELLLQLAGHLRGQALQEWSLIDPIQALRIRLDPGTKAMVAQDFRHLSQADTESVANYIR